MKISEVQIALIKPKDGLIGFASVVFEDVLYLGSIGIYTKLDGSGYRLTFPTRPNGNREFNVYHPINVQCSKAIEQAIFTKLKDVMTSQNDRYHCAHHP